MQQWPTMLALSGLWCTSCVLDRSSVSTGSVPLTQGGAAGTDNTATSGGASGGAGPVGAPGGPSGPGDPGAPGPTTVTIGPPTAKIAIGTHKTFSATASGGTDHAITYSVVESGCGSITSAGVYQAPAVVPATTCTVRATNAASGVFADAKVTVLTAATAAKTVGPPSMTGDAGTITVDFNNVLVTLLPDFMGINGSSFWDGDPLNAHSRDAFKAVGIKTIRYPAGVPGNYFDWSADVVKCDSTTPNVSPTVLEAWQYASAADSSVMFQTNPFPKTTGGCTNDNSGQHAADFVTYAKNQNMNAPYWEIGNEPEGETNPTNAATSWGAPGYSDISLNYAYYIPIFDAQATAMHAANPAISIFGPVGANIWYWQGCNGLDMFLKAEGDKVGTGQTDGVSLHWYPSSDTWAQTQGVTSQSFYDGINFIYSKIFEYDDRDLPVIITETSMSNSGSDNLMPQRIAAAIGTADLLGGYARAGISHVTWFSGRGAIADGGYGAWGTLSSDPNTQSQPTAAFYSFALWSKMGSELVDHVQGLDNTKLVVYATKKSASSVQLMVINKGAAALSQKLAFSGFTPSGTAAVTVNELRAPDGSDYSSTSFLYNHVSNPYTPWSSIPSAISGGTYTPNMTYSFPAYSITVLDFSS